MKLSILISMLALLNGIVGWHYPAGLPCNEFDEVCETPLRPTPDDATQLYGQTSLSNPAVGRMLKGTAGDPLAEFSRRPLDKYIIPAGGAFLDPLHSGPHYGVDYANPDDYLNGRMTYFRPIGPGYVTARSACVMCFAEGKWQGQVSERLPKHNFGWGAFVLTETPYNQTVSIYVMYAHLNRDLVSLGDYVTPDNIVGVVGTSGYSEEIHLHVEIRYGPPGRFWNADFTQYETRDRWLATMFVNPAWVVFPENHPLLVEALGEFAALQPSKGEIP